MSPIKQCLGALFLLGCGGDPMMAMTTDPPVPKNGVQLSTGDYTVQAGEEKYICATVTVPADHDVAITRYDFFSGSLVHHMAVFNTIAPEPAGQFECPATVKVTWLPLGGGGRNTKGVAVPDGAGFKLKAGSQIMIQQHLLNATTKAVTEHSIVNFTFADDASKVIPAGIFAFGSMNIDLPAGVKGKQIVSGCTMQKHLDVFAAFPHMHKLGTRLDFIAGPTQAAATSVYKRAPWMFGEQPMDVLKMTVNPGDYLEATCTYDNTTTADVKYGESTNNEMCYLVLFYTPFDRLDGCVN